MLTYPATHGEPGSANNECDRRIGLLGQAVRTAVPRSIGVGIVVGVAAAGITGNIPVGVLAGGVTAGLGIVLPSVDYILGRAAIGAMRQDLCAQCGGNPFGTIQNREWTK